MEQKVSDYHSIDCNWQLMKYFLDFINPQRVVLIVVPFMVEILLYFKSQTIFYLSIAIEPFQSLEKLMEVVLFVKIRVQLVYLV
jgi:hypothetical protein